MCVCVCACVVKRIDGSPASLKQTKKQHHQQSTNCDRLESKRTTAAGHAGHAIEARRVQIDGYVRAKVDVGALAAASASASSADAFVCVGWKTQRKVSRIGRQAGTGGILLDSTTTQQPTNQPNDTNNNNGHPSNNTQTIQSNFPTTTTTTKKKSSAATHQSSLQTGSWRRH